MKGASNNLKLETLYIALISISMLPGILIDCIYSMLHASYSMRYKLHTLFIPTDIKTWKPRGIINVRSIELVAEAAINIIVRASSLDLACEGTFADVEKSFSTSYPEDYETKKFGFKTSTWSISGCSPMLT